MPKTRWRSMSAKECLTREPRRVSPRQATRAAVRPSSLSQAVSRGEPPSELARGVSNWATTALRGWRSGNRMLCMGAGGTVSDGKLYPARKARGCQEAEAWRRGVRDLRTRADSSQRYRAHGIRGPVASTLTNPCF